MADIDLIPSGYRYWTWQLSTLKRFASWLIFLVVISLGLAFFWNMQAKKIYASTESLQNRMDITQSQRKHLENLINQKNELEHQWKLLYDLRGGTTVEKVLAAIDSVLVPDEVWFLDWRFIRAGYAVDAIEQTEDTGYFIVVSRKNPNSNEPSEMWKINTHISIKGQAKDHASFSSFVQRLIDKPEISDIRVEKTALRELKKGKIVDFNIVVVISNHRGVSS